MRDAPGPTGEVGRGDLGYMVVSKQSVLCFLIHLTYDMKCRHALEHGKLHLSWAIPLSAHPVAVGKFERGF